MKFILPLILFFFVLTPAAMSQAAETGNAPDTVKVGAYVISLHDINFHDKEYTARFWLWFVYNNPDFDFARQLGTYLMPRKLRPRKSSLIVLMERHGLS